MQFEYDPERLIEEVKKRPGIWDFEDVDYRTKNVRYTLWNEVVKELLNSNVKISKSEMRELEMQLQKKWKSIRDCFQKYIQNPNRTRKPYIYSKHLQFLLKNQIVENDGGSSESDVPIKKYKKIWKSKKTLKLRKEQELSSEDDNYGNTNDQSDNDETRDYSNDDIEVETPEKIQKISKPSPPVNEFVFASVDPQVKSDNDDPDRLFLLSLLPHLKTIPEEMRINVKMDLMQVLRNANYGVNRDQKIF